MIEQIKQAVEKEPWTIPSNAIKWVRYLVGEVERLNKDVGQYKASSDQGRTASMLSLQREKEELQEAVDDLHERCGRYADFQVENRDLRNILKQISDMERNEKYKDHTHMLYDAQMIARQVLKQKPS